MQWGKKGRKVGKVIAETILDPIHYLINESLLSGVFPDVMKKAIVCPIYKKKGSKEEPKNYRPISILPYISKILEKVMKQQIVYYFETNKLFHKSQYGYREKLSTAKAVQDLSTLILQNFENRLYTECTFYDLSKAFDCVPHDLLIGKLKKYNFDPSALEMMKSYLTNRQQAVRNKKELSSFLSVTVGVPQGSVLGAILFIIYTNDFTQVDDEADFFVFADDTNSALKGSNLEELKRKNQILIAKIKNWMACNKLTLNTDKTTQVTFSTRPISMPNEEFAPFLGIVLNPTMTWQYQAEKLEKTLCKNMYLLRSLSNSLSKKALLACYHACINSHVNYAILSWGHSQCMKEAFRLQRRAVRIVTDLKYRDDCSQKFEELKILTAPCAYILQCLLFVHDNAENFNVVSQVHRYETRNRENLYEPFARLDRVRDFNYWGIKLYNYLDPETKALPSKNFQDCIKKKLITKKYYSVEEALTDRLGF